MQSALVVLPTTVCLDAVLPTTCAPVCLSARLSSSSCALWKSQLFKNKAFFFFSSEIVLIFRLRL